ncbi:hypothetical protein [Verrucomicrobium spinosum]|uniref:hypothetical protein n=1 Tax=Verrucomicrobium spinosum TaxID=2736 RepID=UPI0012E1E1E3|nr:hypothetical protein [Verrucomicrobium spinosum]
MDKALLLVSSVAHQVPGSDDVEAAVCDVLIACAKAEAKAGRIEKAKGFLRQCIALNPERRLEVLSARELDGIW